MRKGEKLIKRLSDICDETHKIKFANEEDYRTFHTIFVYQRLQKISDEEFDKIVNSSSN